MIAPSEIVTLGVSNVTIAGGVGGMSGSQTVSTSVKVQPDGTGAKKTDSRPLENPVAGGAQRVIWLPRMTAWQGFAGRIRTPCLQAFRCRWIVLTRR